jgi:hypothetical protein
MKNDHDPMPDPVREKRFIERLREHPELMERFEAILEVTQAGGKELLKADQVEELLIEEVRRLGNNAMADWLRQAEARSATEFQAANPGARERKKKT